MNNIEIPCLPLHISLPDSCLPDARLTRMVQLYKQGTSIDLNGLSVVPNRIMELFELCKDAAYTQLAGYWLEEIM